MGRTTTVPCVAPTLTGRCCRSHAAGTVIPGCRLCKGHSRKLYEQWRLGQSAATLAEGFGLTVEDAELIIRWYSSRAKLWSPKA